jgi:hypothetical protein
MISLAPENPSNNPTENALSPAEHIRVQIPSLAHSFPESAVLSSI